MVDDGNELIPFINGKWLASLHTVCKIMLEVCILLLRYRSTISLRAKFDLTWKGKNQRRDDNDGTENGYGNGIYGI